MEPLRAGGVTKSKGTGTTPARRLHSRAVTLAAGAAADGAALSSPSSPSSPPPPRPRRCEISVCSNHWCKSRGAEAALAAFVGLLPEEEEEGPSPSGFGGGGGAQPQVRLRQVGCMGACEKGPNIQVVFRGDSGDGAGDEGYEVHKVADVAKVASVLGDLVGCAVPEAGVRAMQANLEGNQHLERRALTAAVEAYDRALSHGYRPQEGVLLSMRSEAYFARAFSHRAKLEEQLGPGGVGLMRSEVAAAKRKEVRVLSLMSLLQLASSPFAFAALAACANREMTEFHRAEFHLRLYERSLLRSAMDSLRAASLLPALWANAGRAGEAFAALGRPGPAAECYRLAADIAAASSASPPATPAASSAKAAASPATAAAGAGAGAGAAKLSAQDVVRRFEAKAAAAQREVDRQHLYYPLAYGNHDDER